MTLDLFAPKKHAPTLHHGDCLAVLKTLDDASVDAVVTDPPYLIDFMGKGWDSADGIAGKPEVWAECLRVLKPGGHLLAFGATRTYHRMAVAIEDAGFEIRDSIHWMYGSGFPKSLNIGDGRGTALKPAHEPVVVARKPLAGTVAANVQRYGTGALNIDASRVGRASDDISGWSQTGSKAGENRSMSGQNYAREPKADASGRWPPNIVLSHTEDCTESACDETCAVTELDRQSGTLKSGNKVGGQYARTTGVHAGGQRQDGTACYGDSGGASRFFPVFRYRAKASRSERDLGLETHDQKRCGGMTATANGSMLTGSGNPRNTERANTHPTVKPIALMQWLVTLVTPPSGTVLDPFMGSGTTGVAAVRKGFRFVGIEREDEYLAIARARIEAA